MTKTIGDKMILTISEHPKMGRMFRRVSADKDFRQDVIQIRKKFDIPTTGFKSRAAIGDWFGSKSGKQYGKFLDAYEELRKKFRLFPMSVNLLEDHILSNNKISLYPPQTGMFCQIENVPEGGCVKVSIYDHASLKDTQSFLSENWQHIQNLLEEQRGGRLKRIRRAIHKERDELVFKLYSRSREELGLYGKGYKEMAVAKILKEEYGIELDPDNIRKIASKQRKLERM